MRTSPAIELRIRNELSDVGTVSETLDRLAARHTLPHKALIQLQVALDEALSNIIKYAWPDGGEHEAIVEIVIQDDYVHIRIKDDGLPFDPREAVPVTTVPPDLPKGGRGIKMMRQLVDRIDYKRTQDQNMLTLSKYVPQQEETTDERRP